MVSLSSLADSRSRPIGFSTTMRVSIGDQPVCADALGNVAEQRRTDGEIERPHPVAAFVEQPLELVPALIGARVDRNVKQPLKKAV
jgi:hypothetical protein